MDMLEKAVALAVTAHQGQTDKANKPYILHPLRVMQRVSGMPARCAAVLHDVLEDSDCTPADLRRAGISPRVIAAVQALTRRRGESYAAFVRRAGRNPIARQVKIADLEDNMDIRRLSRLTPQSVTRLKRYLAAWRQLSGVR
ncbi:MAG TPA: HD domain-containing protein [bacterium]|nr:HD domain-containing protein [bacterium]